MSSAIVRFAPSPTGYLHVGNARVALINWLLAKSLGGKFILRIDDTDLERSKDEYVQGIETDLTWLGLLWDEKHHQSKRFAQYEAAAETLKAAGRLYACYETGEELDLKRKLQRARGKPPVYDRAALSLSDEDKAKFEAEGRQPHWRFKLDHEDIVWDDLARGECKYNGANVSDPVLIRADGTFLYMLPSAVDDIDMGVTHVVRGEDHVTNTAVQIQLFRALDAEPPQFAHLALMVGAEGQGLSKREGSLSLGEMREDGLEAMAINTLLAKIGSPDPVEVRDSLDQLAAEFDIGKFGRATPRFDVKELEQLNAKMIHAMDFAAVQDRLDAMGLGAMDEAFWEAIRPNLSKLADAKDWWTVCRGTVTPEIEDAAFAATAAGLLPPEPWDEGTWGAFTNAVKAETGAKGKALFMPLRLALTGMSHGPELASLLPLIGRARAEARLKGESA